ncbi:MAG: secondary thiamine-phosphate synthase enzyme YjbQ [Pseudomonadota bacterium]
MTIEQTTLTFQTHGRDTLNITNDVDNIIQDSSFLTGICHLFIKHTSASLILCENADPDVRVDLETFMQHIVPDGSPMFCHDAEGTDDMPAHIRTILTNVSLTLPFRSARCQLGTWQGIYLWEHRTHAHSRNIIVTLYGE